ncbi:MAG: ubiquinol-cytochrome C chaperone [Rhizobiales bacterium]|nr:ubiquinol-cytochrome C chaperone [Hyphomicrobiales bacterium]MBI3671879.1 ubiquinol-cytochrome C chaperone [Hyphomicrobiales bacterium]
MILKRFFSRSGTPERRLYEAIVAASRRPEPFAAWEVADTVDGRFDMIALHLFLTLDRLKGEKAALRQALVDEFFADMDRSLREMGVGDLSVGKKVRKMAESFYGRLTAYDRALREGPEALNSALARNVYPEGADEKAVARLAGYVLEAQRHLAAQDAGLIATGEIAFPEMAP